jgi:hypothetical protein
VNTFGVEAEGWPKAVDDDDDGALFKPPPFLGAPNGEAVGVLDDGAPNWKLKVPGLGAVVDDVGGAEDGVVVIPLNAKVGFVSGVVLAAALLFPPNRLFGFPRPITLPAAGDPAGVVENAPPCPKPPPPPPNGLGANGFEAASAPVPPAAGVVFPNAEAVPKLNFGVMVLLLSAVPCPVVAGSLAGNPKGVGPGFCAVVEPRVKPLLGMVAEVVLEAPPTGLLMTPKLNLGGGVFCGVVVGRLGLANDVVEVLERGCGPPAPGATKPPILENRPPPVDGACSGFFCSFANGESEDDG